MEFAPLAARIDASRKSSQEVSVVLATHEALVQLLGVHAGQHCTETRRKHRLCEGGRFLLRRAVWEQRLDPRAIKKPDPIHAVRCVISPEGNQSSH